MAPLRLRGAKTVRGIGKRIPNKWKTSGRVEFLGGLMPRYASRVCDAPGSTVTGYYECFIDLEGSAESIGRDWSVVARG
jgi:hypothetical protein